MGGLAVRACFGDPDKLNAGDDEDAELRKKQANKHWIRTIIFGIIVTLGIIEDEFIWIPFLMYASYVKMLSYVVAWKNSVLIMSPCQLVSNTVSAVATRYGMLALASHAPGVFHADAVRGILRSPGAVLAAPVTWPLRLSFHTTIIRRWMIQHGDDDPPGLMRRFTIYSAAGGASELLARVATAPIVKALSVQRKMAADGASGGGITSALRYIHNGALQDATGKYRLTRSSSGLLGFWTGTAPLRVEVPHMALLLGAFTTLREEAVKRVCAPWDPARPWAEQAPPRAPIDFCCGAAAAAVASAVTLPYRLSVDEDRAGSMAFSKTARKHERMQTVQRHGALELRHVLKVRAPQTGVIFAASGLLHALMEPGRRELGYGCGWGEYDVDKNAQGQSKIFLQHRKQAKEYNVGHMFGGMLPGQEVDWDRRARDRKRIRAAQKGETIERPPKEGELHTIATCLRRIGGPCSYIAGSAGFIYSGDWCCSPVNPMSAYALGIGPETQED